jgi:hypothetical protein
MEAHWQANLNSLLSPRPGRADYCNCRPFRINNRDIVVDSERSASTETTNPFPKPIISIMVCM